MERLFREQKNKRKVKNFFKNEYNNTSDKNLIYTVYKEWRPIHTKDKDNNDNDILF